jgi:DNA-binding NarL/FixJ family response regulator
MREPLPKPTQQRIAAPPIRSAGITAPSSPAVAPVRILLVTDVHLYREGLRQLLSVHEGIAKVVAVPTLEDAIDCIVELQPTVVLVDMTTLLERDAVLVLTSAWSATKVVAFAVDEGAHDVVACAEMGASGYVPRSGSTEDLVTTIQSVARDEVACSPRAAAALFRRLATLAATPNVSVGLAFTIRERQIAELLARGLSNKEIARELSIEVATVKNHVHHVLEKLHVRGRAQVAVQLIGSGARGDRQGLGPRRREQRRI